MGADGASVLEQQELAELSTQPGNAEGADGIMPSSVVPVAVRIGGEPQEGRTVPQEMPPALIGPTSLRLAAAEGDPSAEFEVAARFAEGKGIRQDFKQAARWYQRSASQGFALAQYRLGTLYERGLAVSADLARARVWYARAAELGNVKAMHNLAVLSAGRDRSTPDYTTAAHWSPRPPILGSPTVSIISPCCTKPGLASPRTWYRPTSGSRLRPAVGTRNPAGGWSWRR